MSLNFAQQVHAQGTVVVSNPAAAVNIVLGWTPRFVEAWNVNNLVQYKHFATMGAGTSLDIGNHSDTQISVNSADSITNYAGLAAGGAISGTVTVTAASASVAGSSTNFIGELAIGDKITINGETRIILSIASKTALVVTVPFVAAASTVACYDVTGKGAGFTLGTDICDTAADVVHWVALR